MTIRIGHLSDIHVPALEPFSLRDLFSKRITGFLNFKWKREKEYHLDVLKNAIDRLIAADVDAVIVSGDLSNLAYEREFQAAFDLLQPLSHADIPWFVIPGNHDRYLRSAIDGRMERIFAKQLGDPLSNTDVYPWIKELPDAVLIGLNSAVPTPPFQAWGVVSEDQLDALRSHKERILQIGKPIVLAVHHHIGKAPHKKNDHNRNLRNSDEVMRLCEELGVKLVLHGHNHFLDIQQLQDVRVFAASSGISNQSGVHRTAGQVAIHQLEAYGAITHEVAFWEGDTFGPWRAITSETLPPRPNALPAQARTVT